MLLVSLSWSHSLQYAFKFELSFVLFLFEHRFIFKYYCSATLIFMYGIVKVWRVSFSVIPLLRVDLRFCILSLCTSSPSRPCVFDRVPLSYHVWVNSNVGKLLTRHWYSSDVSNFPLSLSLSLKIGAPFEDPEIHQLGDRVGLSKFRMKIRWPTPCDQSVCKDDS